MIMKSEEKKTVKKKNATKRRPTPKIEQPTENRAAHRPKIYSAEYFIEKMPEYLEHCNKPRTVTSDRIIPNELPTIVGFCIFCDNCSSETLSKYEKANIELMGTLNQLREIQKNSLINKGLSGDYKEGMVKFLLSVNHGMSEKTIQQHEGEIKTTPATVNFTVHKK